MSEARKMSKARKMSEAKMTKEIKRRFAWSAFGLPRSALKELATSGLLKKGTYLTSQIGAILPNALIGPLLRY